MALDEYVLAFVMAGGRGTRLEILTKERTKPAIGIHGIYRIIDYVVSNITNTGIPSTIIAAQFEPRSLIGHLRDGSIWGFDGIDRKLEIVHPYEEGKKIVRFEGTADSVRKNLHRINRYNPRIVFVLGGDHVYCMNYEAAIKQHISNNADITIMANLVPESKAHDFGLIKIDEQGRIIAFAEKPKEKEVIEEFRLTPIIKSRLGIPNSNSNLDFLASMGNYIFFHDQLEVFLKQHPGDDFGKEIIPSIKENKGRLYAYVFNGYWRDVGKLVDYFNCNMDFTKERAPLDLIANRVRTSVRYLPGPRIASGASVQSCILSPGDEISKGCVVKNSVIGYQTLMEKDSELKECILLGADRNEFFNNKLRHENITHIGEGSKLEKVILDKNVKIGKNVIISPEYDTYEEREEKLKSIGLKPYTELEDGRAKGDYYLDKETGILVIAKQRDPTQYMFPSNFEC